MSLENFDEGQYPAESEGNVTASESLEGDSMRAMQGFQDDGQIPVEQELGLTNFKVADLPTPEDVNGPDDFHHHIEWEDAQTACQRFPEVQKQVEAGKTRDDFFREDQEKGLAWNDKNASTRVYDLFYSKNDPIAISKDHEGGYSIDSGRHRIFMAKHEGLDTIPVKVNQ